ncbi:hypothetical protein OESDEN_20491 [Oesophagostomum dentatum]|uniref:Uncharacterized protein n=1 Tax=Oesophagostomum dentatum TaxID=61180 RepID=A0A0B1S4I3_OESDE|nr:hypothetical protein OESDEN_20491 [Oesophagostomum dentatum]
MSRRHQKVVISLDEKIAEGEKMVEKLTADKKALQVALANDSDQRNQVRDDLIFYEKKPIDTGKFHFTYNKFVKKKLDQKASQQICILSRGMILKGNYVFKECELSLTRI